jgi:DNA-binding winged helix-turn-helix (wHTH) protein
VSAADEVVVVDGAVLWDGGRTPLWPTELQLLIALAAGQGQFRSKRDLSVAVWGEQSDTLRLQVTIHRLRRKLKEQAELVENSPRQGYRLRGTLRMIEEEATG